MSGVGVFGLVVVVVGALMTVFPVWFGPLTGGSAPPADTFEAIERRIRGGMVAGVGLVLIARTALRPWSVTIASVVFYVLLGALVARVLGLLIEGTDSRQWLYVAVEGGLIALPALWLWRVGSGG